MLNFLDPSVSSDYTVLVVVPHLFCARLRYPPAVFSLSPPPPLFSLIRRTEHFHPPLSCSFCISDTLFSSTQVAWTFSPTYSSRFFLYFPTPYIHPSYAGGVEGGGGAVTLDVVRPRARLDEHPRLAARLRVALAGLGNHLRSCRRGS